MLPGSFAHDVLTGLSASPKHLHSRYFYDDRGSQLFEQIMELPEYYLTRCEAEIFERYKQTVLQMCEGEKWSLVDLGAGDATKTRIWIDYFYRHRQDFSYIPADISAYALEELTASLQNTYPTLEVKPVKGEYNRALEWIGREVTGKKFVLFMGSNIGNFSESECIAFLHQIRQALSVGDRLLIGFDLKKEGKIIHAAYNDSSGVTEAFNKNLLIRINRELGGQFNPDSFDFHANYDPVSGFVRSYLVSKKAQTVSIEALGRSFHFHPWETIHAENSRKFSLKEIETLAAACGFTIEKHLLDGQEWFVDTIWRV